MAMVVDCYPCRKKTIKIILRGLPSGSVTGRHSDRFSGRVWMGYSDFLLLPVYLNERGCITRTLWERSCLDVKNQAGEEFL